MEKTSNISTSSRIIDPQQIVNKVSNQDKQNLTCLICLGIVINPIQCSKCQTLFCQSQLLENLKYINCPICKSKLWKKGSQIHKSYKSKLMSLQIKCNIHQECSKQIFTYQKYVAHLNKKENSQIKSASQKSQISQTAFYQFYYNISKDDGWEQYPQESNISANINYRHSILQFMNGNYLIDLNKMVQKNVTTSYERAIKMQKIDTRKPKPYWTVDVEGCQYELYNSKNNQQIQKAYQQYLLGSKETLKIKYSKYQYEIDFSKMVQLNVVTKKQRKIARIAV